MISNRRPPLTPLAQEALDALMSAVPNDGELTYEYAYDVLAQEEDLNQPAAEDIIERLYMRGHVYEVEGKLRLTDY
ncbi:hypothetical protein [Haladaptatus halobius]|uniref:hypothetical protein n=1 Tax=Haladaptatus halobius TaxID=2884875 RepID=UPI001D0A15E6|nr:hypothetical protein [Haladaptatus halobius]